jgi:hypothetical protein
MNEVNMKYWFSDFKKKIMDFLDELGLFIEEKPIFTKNENSVALGFDLMKNFMLSSKKYTLRGLKCNRESWEPKNGIW